MSNPFEAIEQRLSVIEVLLSKLATSFSNPSHESSDIIDINEVAKMLHLSKDTVYTKTHKKIIPHTKQGKKLLFSRKRIEAFIAEGEVKTFNEEFRQAQRLITHKINKKR